MYNAVFDNPLQKNFPPQIDVIFESAFPTFQLRFQFSDIEGENREDNFPGTNSFKTKIFYFHAFCNNKLGRFLLARI